MKERLIDSWRLIIRIFLSKITDKLDFNSENNYEYICNQHLASRCGTPVEVFQLKRNKKLS